MTTPDHAALETLNENYIRAVRESDTGWFDGNLSADFLNSNPDGSLVDRAGFLAQIARPTTVPDLACEDVQIRILNDTALIHARTAYTKADGQRGGGRYTDIWMRQPSGRWLCVAAHVTRS
ncbi:nuclear transport factor 2 family protein [Ferrovibrio terrae]|uniref:Nuclear transport factor 2 family protein n=1 Tax=Ferrovibrio terrae TaxID=2594003 RepID=A0A516H248_9PROT|nr:nuclear transport factor 2 family protein [Ferrovibrio terrae]QDO97851.1 nuclear transport factor 2 family protein [Ferrovibrio terrae]